jgi:GNAT superfamily N-acetyltransferase
VLYLPIDPEAAKSVVMLREKVFQEPLARPLTWPFVPHVTIGDEVAPERIAAAELALSDYRTDVTFDRVHLLREGEGRVWGPIADARFGGPAVVGRGGLPVELAVTDGLDPDTLRFVEREWDSYWLNQIGSLSRKADFNVVARRDGAVVGVAQGWVRGHVGYLEDLIVAQPERGMGVGSRLLDAFVFESAQRGCDRVMLSTWEGTDAEAFYRRKGWVEEARFDYWVAGRKMLRLSREI